MTALIFALAAVLVGSSDASATSTSQTPPTAVAQAQQPPADDSNKVVCKSEPVTGSRFNKRVCLTKAEWAARQAAADKFKNEVEQRGSISTMPAQSAP